MIIALLFGLLIGNTTQLQLKFDHCKSEGFKTDYCSNQEKLSKLKNNKE